LLKHLRKEQSEKNEWPKEKGQREKQCPKKKEEKNMQKMKDTG
jgi:hypothetical protein